MISNTTSFPHPAIIFYFNNELFFSFVSRTQFGKASGSIKWPYSVAALLCGGIISASSRSALRMERCLCTMSDPVKSYRPSTYADPCGTRTLANGCVNARRSCRFGRQHNIEHYVSARECIFRGQFVLFSSSQTCKGQRVRFLFIMEYGNIWEFGLSLNNVEESDGGGK